MGEVPGVVALDGAICHENCLLRQRGELAQGAGQGSLEIVVVIVGVVSGEDGRLSWFKGGRGRHGDLGEGRTLRAWGSWRGTR